MELQAIINAGATGDFFSFVTRQDVEKFPFPYKLWIVVHLDFCDFLRWDRDGTVLLLDLIPLEEYLISPRSIFKIKNRSVFLNHLQQFKFERLNATPEAEEDLLMQYKNENFQRHRIDLLARLRRHNVTTCCQSTPLLPQSEQSSSTTIEMHRARVYERMLGDLCFMTHGALSSIYRSRLQFQTLVGFENETRSLREKLELSDEDVVLNQRDQKPDIIAHTTTNDVVVIPPLVGDEEQLVELPVDLFENPHDSVLHLGEDFRPEYAGYYGNCSRNQILHFFGDYLPMHEIGSMEVKKIAGELGSNNHLPLSRDVIQSNQDLSAPGEEYATFCTTTPGFMPEDPMSSLHFSSTLDPIYKDDDDDSNHIYTTTHVNTNNNNVIDVDISMDEFIKFKDNNNVDQIKTEESSGEFQQTPDIKMELSDEESENEANFRNFFNQYRASLNLLYDGH